MNMNDDSFIPFHRPSIGAEENDAVLRVLASGWLTTGPVAMEFEQQFARFVGSKHALAVNSCTAALQLALDAIRLQAGDEVLVPAYTFTATAEVVTYFGARPVLCDSQRGSFNIDPEDAERRITEKTRAIIPVHIAGLSCDLDAIHDLGRRHGLRIIEDAAHSLPATYRGRRIGSVSELTAFSFYTTKTITTGEGGMLTTDDDGLAERISLMRLHGIGRDAWKRYAKTGSWFYEVQEAGYKMNMPDLLAAIGLAQLQKCEQFWKRRSEIAAYYQERFSSVEELEVPPCGSDESQHSWHLYILRLQPTHLGIDRNAFIQELKAAGIGTSVHFIPLHLHPFYVSRYGYTPESLPQALSTFSRSFSLPIYPDLTDSQCERIANSVLQIVTNNRKKLMVTVR
jgi:dTDP-4-amino-4,6-dideoxygalactose transaminase